MLGDGVEIEVWWQDEARVGQKNKITRRWSKRGTVSTQGPEDDLGLYLHLPRAKLPALSYANTEALNAHLKEIACIVEPSAVVMPSRMAHLPGPRSP